MTLLLGAVTAGTPAQTPTGRGVFDHRASSVYAVSGRCVAAETGQPLAACSIVVTGHQSTGYPLSWAALDWHDPVPVETGADGRFRIELRLPASVYPPGGGWPDRIHVRVTHRDHAGWFVTCKLPVFVDRGGVHLGDVSMTRGSRPVVNVVDTNGLAERQALVAFELEKRPAPGGDPFSLNIFRTASHRAYTSSEGRVRLTSALQPGTWRVSVDGREVQRGGTLVVPPPPKRAQRCQVVLAVLPSRDLLSGRLIDPSGEGIGGVLARLEGPAGTTSNPLYVRTNDAGAFCFVRGAEAPRDPVLALGVSRFDTWLRHGAVEWGRSDLRLAAPAATTLRLAVMSSDGKPVETLSVHCVPGPDGGISSLHEYGRFARGEVVIPGVRCGRYDLLVYPHDGRFAANAWTSISVDDRAGAERIVLPATVARTVRVVLPRGTGNDVRVDLVRLVRGAAKRTRARPVARWLGERRPHVIPDLLLARAWTDEAGRVVLRAVPADDPFELRIGGASVQPASHAIRGWSAGEELVVEARRGVTLSGTVRPAARIAACFVEPEHRRATAYGSAGMLPELHGARPSLVVRPEDDGEGWNEKVFGLMADGSYRIEGLPPGKCSVSFVYWKDSRTRAEPVKLGTIELRAGEPLGRDFDLPQER